MTDREKMVGIMGELPTVFCDLCGEDCSQNKMLRLADHLIANGVMVQNWRTAKTDPPPQDEDVLLCFANGTMVVGGLREDGGWYANVDAEWYTDCEIGPVKWQPLP